MYLHDGTEVEVVAKLDDSRVLVRAWMEDTDRGELFLSDCIRIVYESDLHENPPTEVVNKEIEKAKARLRKLERRAAEVQSKSSRLEREYKQLIDKLSRYKPLEYIEQFLDGKITHFVVIPGYGEWKIKTLDEMQSRYGGTKLLSLFGESKGNLEWCINSYPDGSGLWTHVVPCLSYEHAIEVMQERINDEVAKSADNPRLSLVSVAEKYGLEIDRSYVKAAREKYLDSLRKRRAEILRSLEKITDEITRAVNTVMEVSDE